MDYSLLLKKLVKTKAGHLTAMNVETKELYTSK